MRTTNPIPQPPKATRKGIKTTVPVATEAKHSEKKKKKPKTGIETPEKARKNQQRTQRPVEEKRDHAGRRDFASSGREQPSPARKRGVMDHLKEFPPTVGAVSPLPTTKPLSTSSRRAVVTSTAPPPPPKSDKKGAKTKKKKSSKSPKSRTSEQQQQQAAQQSPRGVVVPINSIMASSSSFSRSQLIADPQLASSTLTSVSTYSHVPRPPNHNKSKRQTPQSHPRRMPSQSMTTVSSRTDDDEEEETTTSWNEGTYDDDDDDNWGYDARDDDVLVSRNEKFSRSTLSRDNDLRKKVPPQSPASREKRAVTKSGSKAKGFFNSLFGGAVSTSRYITFLT